jgi:hypothetical protein
VYQAAKGGKGEENPLLPFLFLYFLTGEAAIKEADCANKNR